MAARSATAAAAAGAAGAAGAAAAAPRRVVIAGAARTPIGSFGGSLASMKGPALAAASIKASLAGSGAAAKDIQVDECLLGNVLQAGQGQAPARQAALAAGLGESVPSTTVNKVCASGMKAVQLAAAQIMIGQAKCVLAGGFESMSNVPYYSPGARFGARYGHSELQDGIVKDGLWDVYNDFHMGMCAEHCASENSIDREAQDAFAIESYRRAAEATERGAFKDEIVPITIKSRGKETVVDTDEEFKRFNKDKVATLKPAFKKAEEGGTVTAVNASSLNDGAATMLVLDEEYATEIGATPIATVLGFADFAHEPINFTTAPAYAIPLALKNAGVAQEDVARWEINEAFAVVSLINNKLLSLDPEKVNPNGGATALGHPIGASGARIIVSLLHGLEPGQIGCAAICNGGGGASAIVFKRH